VQPLDNQLFKVRQLLQAVGLAQRIAVLRWVKPGGLQARRDFRVVSSLPYSATGYRPAADAA
jgi:hypothetical protein